MNREIAEAGQPDFVSIFQTPGRERHQIAQERLGLLLNRTDAAHLAARTRGITFGDRCREEEPPSAKLIFRPADVCVWVAHYKVEAQPEPVLLQREIGPAGLQGAIAV